MSYVSSDRLHGLDAVRGGALLLGVLFHAALSFTPGDQFWLVMDNERSAALSGLAFVLHIFRMTVFFLLAGYFGRMQLNRLGQGAFLKDRLKRVGVPLVVFWPIVMACIIALAVWAMVVANGGTMPENPPPAPPITLETFPLTHLWFLYCLLLFYAGTILVRMLMARAGVLEALAQAGDKALGWLLSTGILPLALALPTAFAFMQSPDWHPSFGIPAPDYGFVPNRIALTAYGTAFGLGWLLQRDAQSLLRATKQWAYYLVGAVALTGYCLSVVGFHIPYVQPLPEGATYLYPAAYAIAVWLWTFGLIGLSLKAWSKESRVRRYIADASYWVYLIHLPIVMAAQVWVSQWALAAELKFALILFLSVPLMFFSYEVLVRYTFIGRMLNGNKHSRQNHQIAEKTA